MNQFWSYENFVGKVEVSYLVYTTRQLFELVISLGIRLGVRKHLIDEYVCAVLEALDVMDMRTAAENGAAAFLSLRCACLAVMDGKTDYFDEDTYEIAKKYINGHPLKYRDNATRLGLYCMALVGEVMKLRGGDYYFYQRQKQLKICNLDKIRGLYYDLCAALGGEQDLEQLNLLIRQRFLHADTSNGFMQGVTDELLKHILRRDPETGKPVVQLWIDEMHSEKIRTMLKELDKLEDDDLDKQGL
jgi:hypothetical protein